MKYRGMIMWLKQHREELRMREDFEICPVCGYEFKFGTPDEIEFHRVICVPSDDWEDDDDE